MAVTTETSDQIDNVNAKPPVMNPACQGGGVSDNLVFNFTQGAAAGDAGSTADLVQLPPGLVRVFLSNSHIEWTAFGAARVLDIGYAAYVQPDGTAVVADDNAFDDNIDVSSAGNAALGSDVAALSGKMMEFNSRDGVTLFATVAGGTIPAAAGLHGWVQIQRP